MERRDIISSKSAGEFRMINHLQPSTSSKQVGVSQSNDCRLLVSTWVMSRHSVAAGLEVVEDLAQNQCLVLRQMRIASDD